MIDIKKVRLWTVHFSHSALLNTLPYPGDIVEEVEGPGYHMPQYLPSQIPVGIGGQITLTLAGRGRLKVGNKTYELNPGSAFLARDCDPQVSYYFPKDGQRKWRFIWINFMGESSAQIIEDINRKYGYFFDLGPNSALKNELLSYKEYAGTILFQSPLEGAKMMFDLLNMLCWQEDGRSSIPRRTRRVREVQSELQFAFDESISTSTLARKLGISREHLSKTFHAETGQTLRDYRNDQRLTEAIALLLKTDMRCKEIARICHFGSYSSFFRAMQKAYNMSPDEIREKR